jgi:hypothetical protein
MYAFMRRGHIPKREKGAISAWKGSASLIVSWGVGKI